MYICMYARSGRIIYKSVNNMISHEKIKKDIEF